MLDYLYLCFFCSVCVLFFFQAETSLDVRFDRQICACHHILWHYEGLLTFGYYVSQTTSSTSLWTSPWYFRLILYFKLLIVTTCKLQSSSTFYKHWWWVTCCVAKTVHFFHHFYMNSFFSRFLYIFFLYIIESKQHTLEWNLVVCRQLQERQVGCCYDSCDSCCRSVEKF